MHMYEHIHAHLHSLLVGYVSVFHAPVLQGAEDQRMSKVRPFSKRSLPLPLQIRDSPVEKLGCN